MNKPNVLRKVTEWVDKHTNPIALLETQQVLALKRTLIVYGLLVVALWMGSCAVVRETSSGGEEMSFLLLGTYALIATLILPAQILFNSSNRWSKDKLDMIHITQLRPMDIVVGRLFSGVALLILLGATIIPFVSLTYLMPGTQIDLILLGMVFVFMVGVLTILFTLNTSWRLEEYTFVSIGKVFWLFLLFQVSFGLVGGVIAFVENTSTSELLEMVQYLPWGIAGWCVMVYIGITQSVLLFRHPESNRSTPYRIGLVLLYMLAMAVILQAKRVAGLSDEQVSGLCLFGMTISGLTCFPLMLEDEIVGRKAFVEFPKTRLKRMLMFPLLPSAGSGMVLMLLMMGGLMVLPPLSITFGDKFAAFIYTPLQTFAFVGLVLPRLRKIQALSILSRRNLVIVLYVPAIAAIFAVLAFVLQDVGLFEVMMRYVFPFAWLDMMKSNAMDGMMLWSVGTASLCLIVNRRAIVDAWDVIVNGRHPAFDGANPYEQSETQAETIDEAV